MLAEIKAAGERATADVVAASRAVAAVSEVFPEHMRLLGEALIGRMAGEMQAQIARAETARRSAVRAAWVSGAAGVTALLAAGSVLLRVL